VSHGILTEEDLPLVLEAPRRGHSQKPDEAYHALDAFMAMCGVSTCRGSAICPHRALTRHVRTQAASRLDKLEQRPRGRIRERAGERVREQTGEQNTTCISRRLNLPRHTTYRLGPSAGPWPAASSRSIASCATTIIVAGRIASPEMLSDTELLPHLICSPPVGGGGDIDEAGQHGSA
jgi:hypothetical protein